MTSKLKSPSLNLNPNQIQMNYSKNTTPEGSITKNTMNLYSSRDFEQTNESKNKVETIIKKGKINRDRLN